MWMMYLNAINGEHKCDVCEMKFLGNENASLTQGWEFVYSDILALILKKLQALRRLGFYKTLHSMFWA